MAFPSHAHVAMNYTFSELQAGLEALVSEGNVTKRTCYRHGKYACYSYKSVVHANWKNPFMCIARGIVLDPEREKIIALPFSKFFNYNEHPPKRFPEIVSIEIKYDGSLGIAYWYDLVGEWRMKTKGSFESQEAAGGDAAVKKLTFLDDLPKELTFLSEILCPVSKVIINYDMNHLRAITAINPVTGVEMGRTFLEDVFKGHDDECPLVHVMPFESVDQIKDTLERMDATKQEGWIVKFEDGSRRKFKGLRYLALHRIKSNISKKRVFEVISAHDTLEDGVAEMLRMADELPEEHYNDIKNWVNELSETYTTVTTLFKKDIGTNQRNE